MPLVFRLDGYRFFFYSNEGDPREPVHVHVRSADGEAKIWVRPTVAVASSHGYDSRTLRKLCEIASQEADRIERAWHEHFS